jgi:hypothetical protein
MNIEVVQIVGFRNVTAFDVFLYAMAMWGSVFCKKSLLDLSGQCQSALTCFLGFGKGSMCQAFMFASFWPSLHSAIFAVLVVL